MALGESLNFTINVQDNGSSAISGMSKSLESLGNAGTGVGRVFESLSQRLTASGTISQEQVNKLNSLRGEYERVGHQIGLYTAALKEAEASGNADAAYLEKHKAAIGDLQTKYQQLGGEIDKLSGKKAEPPVDVQKTEQAVQSLGKLPPEIKKTEQAAQQAAPKLKETAQATEQVEQKAKQAEPALGQMAAKMAETAEKSGALHNAMSTLAGGLSIFAGNLYTQAFSGIAGAIGGIKDAMIGGNAQFEYYEGQFATLLHSTDAAKQHIADLSKFAAVTPFDLPQVVEASKNLLTFGGQALDTQATLTLVGNAAAATGQNFNEVAFWTGRAYNAMMAGKPFGEATMRLMEMGIMTGDTANKLEALQKQGAKGPELWKAFSTGIVSPSDAMDKLGHTAQGLQSTLEDTLAGLGRTIGKPLFEAQKAGLESLINFLSSDFVNNLANSLAGAIQQFLNFKSAVIQSIVAPIQQFMQYAQPLLSVIPQLGFYMQSWGQAIGTAGGAWEGLIRWFEQAFTHFALLIDKYLPGSFGGLMQFGGAVAHLLDTFTPVADALGEVFMTLGEIPGALQSNIQEFGSLGEGITQTFGYITANLKFYIVNDLIPALSTWAAKAIPPMLAHLQELGQRLFDWIGAQAPAIAAQLLSWYTSFLGWILPLAGQLTNRLFQLGFALDGWILQQAGKLAQQLLVWGQAFIAWIEPQIPGIIAQAQALAQQLMAWIGQQVGPLVNQMMQWGQAFIAWIGPMIPPFLQSLGELANQFIAWIGQQVGPLLQQFNQWVQPILAWIPGAVAQFLTEWPGMLDQFLTWIGQQVGPLLGAFANWAGALIGWIMPAMPGILLALAGVVAAILVWAGETFLVLMHKFSEWGAALVGWIAPRIPGVLAAAGEMLLSIGGWILGTGLPFLIAKLLEWGKAFVEWAGKVWSGGGGVPPLSTQVNTLLTNLGTWITGTALPAIVQKLGEWAKAFVDWLVNDARPKLLAALGNLADAIFAWLGQTAKQILSSASQIGASITDGIKNGIAGGIQSVKDMAGQAAQAALDSAKNTLGIHSPSTEFLAIGMNTMGAWAQGVLNTANQPIAAVGMVAGGVIGAGQAATNPAVFNAGLGGIPGVIGGTGSIAGGGILFDPSRIFGAPGGGVIGGAGTGTGAGPGLGAFADSNVTKGLDGLAKAAAWLGQKVPGGIIANLGNVGAINPVPVISHDGHVMAIADLGNVGTIGGPSGSVAGGGILIDPARIANLGDVRAIGAGMAFDGNDQTGGPSLSFEGNDQTPSAVGQGVGLRHLAGMTQAPETPEGKAMIARAGEATAQVWVEGMGKSPAFRDLGYQLLTMMVQQLAKEQAAI